MAHTLELEPERFYGADFLPKTPTAAVYSSFLHELRDDLARQILAPDFDPSAVVDSFHQTIGEYKDGIVGIRVESEKISFSEEFQPLTRKLGSLAIPPEAADSVTLDDGFVEDLHQQIDSLELDFSPLATWRQELGQTKILDLIQQINGLYTADPAGNSWVPTAYRLVQNAAENPQEFTLPAEGTDALYLITFLPYPVRGLVRRMIVGNVITDQVRQNLGETTVAEENMLMAMSKFYASDALHGQYWDQMLARDGMADTDDISIEMSQYSGNQLEALADIQRSLEDGQAGRVPEVWKQVTEKLKERMENLYKTQGLDAWQIQDIGHCFEGFNDWELNRAFNPDNNWLLHFEEETKNGLKALVLEDDPNQRANFANIIDAHTPYITDPDLIFETPEGIDDALRDPSIGLYVLDIQNGLDDTAGIRVAEQIFKTVIAQNESQPDEPRRVKIILWSSSPKAATAASVFFKDYIEEQLDDDDVSYRLFTGSGRSSGGTPISIDIRLKRWSASSDTRSR